MNPTPAVNAIPEARFALEGEIGRRLAAVTAQWILPAPFANPGMLEMFRNRDRKPYQDQVPWAGEFAGKYLTHSVQVFKLNRDPALGKHLQWFVSEFIALQDTDGYLGPWPRTARIVGPAENCSFGRATWDAWGHYHAMVGLLLWHETSGDRKALDCVCRMADLFCRRFLPSAGGKEQLHSSGSHEMNQAPIHALGMLYRLTGVKRYLEMALQIESEFAIPPAGDYTRTALQGLEFFETPKPRWESLHPIMGLVELYYATGRESYRTAFEHLWWSMLKGDRHNNGGFTSGERATGNPYDPSPIETCCTIAWMAMSVEMLKLTGSSIVADEIELALLNSGIGMMSPSGRWVTYNTPMDGQRRASAHDIVFQSRAGTPELNCCSVNGPRALGMISEWAVMRRDDGLVINYYGPGAMTAALPSGNRVRFTQETDYPRNGDVQLRIKPDRAEPFVLALRIPYWSEKTIVSVNGKRVKTVKAGTYLELDRRWKAGDRIAVAFDFRPHFWAGRPAGEQRNLEIDWKLFGPAPRPQPDPNKDLPPVIEAQPSLEGRRTIPREMTINGVRYAAVAASSKGGIIAGREVFPEVGGAPVMFGFAELEVTEAQDLMVTFAADWWTAWYVNGQKVFDNHATNGNGGDLTIRNNTFSARLKAGRNLLSVRVSGGSTKGCWLSMGRSLLQSEVEAAPKPEFTVLCSIYRGPILLAYDPRHNATDPEEFPILKAGRLKLKAVEERTWLKPWILLEATAQDGRKLRLCDFGSAGAAGNPYKSWLPVSFREKPGAVFSPENPLRTIRQG
jgi:DUF1680 family protein